MRFRLAIVTMALCLCLILALCPPLASLDTALAADAGRTTKGLHGQPWAFGASQSREDALWQRGVNVDDMKHKATPDTPLHKSGAVADTPSQERAKRTHGKKDDIGLSWDRPKGGWRSSASPNTPDEHLPVVSEHRVRAFADVPAGDDLSIKMGPEVIVKDGKETPYTGKHNEDPKSAVGMGMQFKLDF